MELVKQISYSATLKAMMPGAAVVVSMDDLTPNGASNVACRIGRDMGRKYSVHRDYERRELTITRVA